MNDEEILERVRKILYENMISGRRGDWKFHYTKPSPGRYPFQFFWDTCFHIFILSALGECEMAKEHFKSLFAMQRDDGFVGHMIYWDRLKPGRITDIFQSEPTIKTFFHSHMSALIHPPLAAQALARIYQADGDTGFLKNFLPQLKKYYRWLAVNRDFEGTGLLTIISPFESGMDWKPTYDAALRLPEKRADWRLFLKVVGTDLRNYLNRYNLKKIYRKGYFLVKDVGVNTIYAQNLSALADLCKITGDSDSEYFARLRDKVAASILEVMYDDAHAAFYDVQGKDHQKIKISTPTIFYPVVLKEVPEAISKKVLEKHFFNEEEFGAKYPILSVAKNHRSFNPGESMYIWRGPVWIVNNWFMHQFLMEKGYENESKKLIDSIKALINKSGFREYYNPFTGEGYGARDFTWAGLVADMIKMDKSFDKKNLSTDENG